MWDFLVPSIPGFTFGYPFVMAWYWMTGGVLHRLVRGWHEPRPGEPPPLASYPPVSILVPCHNEGENVREVFAALDAVDYPDFEMIGINDGSRDETGAILDELAGKYPASGSCTWRPTAARPSHSTRARLPRATNHRGDRRRLAPRSRRGHVVRPPLPLRWHARGAHREPAHPQPIVAARQPPGRRVLRHCRTNQARPDALRLRVHRLRRGLRVPQAGPPRGRVVVACHAHRRRGHDVANPDGRMDGRLRAQGALLDTDARDAPRSVAAAASVVGGRYPDGAEAHAPDVPSTALAAVDRVAQLHAERAVGVHMLTGFLRGA